MCTPVESSMGDIQKIREGKSGSKKEHKNVEGNILSVQNIENGGLKDVIASNQWDELHLNQQPLEAMK